MQSKRIARFYDFIIENVGFDDNSRRLTFVSTLYVSSVERKMRFVYVFVLYFGIFTARSNYENFFIVVPGDIPVVEFYTVLSRFYRHAVIYDDRYAFRFSVIINGKQVFSERGFYGRYYHIGGYFLRFSVLGGGKQCEKIVSFYVRVE